MLNKQSGAGQALLDAVRTNEITAVESLLKAGADTSLMTSMPHLNMKICGVIHLAIINENYEMLELLLKYGANANQKDKKDYHGNTPLHDAVLKNDARMVGLLVKWGASLEMKTVLGQTALELASSNGYWSCVEAMTANYDAGFNKAPWLIEEDVDPNLVLDTLLQSDLSDEDIKNLATRKGLKEKIFKEIKGIERRREKKSVVEKALDKETALGKFFWTRRGLWSPSVKRGALGELYRFDKELEQQGIRAWRDFRIVPRLQFTSPAADAVVTNVTGEEKKVKLAISDDVPAASETVTVRSKEEDIVNDAAVVSSTVEAAEQTEVASPYTGEFPFLTALTRNESPPAYNPEAVQADPKTPVVSSSTTDNNDAAIEVTENAAPVGDLIDFSEDVTVKSSSPQQSPTAATVRVSRVPSTLFAADPAMELLKACPPVSQHEPKAERRTEARAYSS